MAAPTTNTTNKPVDETNRRDERNLAALALDPEYQRLVLAAAEQWEALANVLAPEAAEAALAAEEASSEARCRWVDLVGRHEYERGLRDGMVPAPVLLKLLCIIYMSLERLSEHDEVAAEVISEQAVGVVEQLHEYVRGLEGLGVAVPGWPEQGPR